MQLLISFSYLYSKALVDKFKMLQLGNATKTLKKINKKKIQIVYFPNYKYAKLVHRPGNYFNRMSSVNVAGPHKKTPDRRLTESSVIADAYINDH